MDKILMDFNYYSSLGMGGEQPSKKKKKTVEFLLALRWDRWIIIGYKRPSWPQRDMMSVSTFRMHIAYGDNNDDCDENDCSPNYQGISRLLLKETFDYPIFQSDKL